jgi:hypothetical protein
MRVVTLEMHSEAGERGSPGDGCRGYACCGAQHDGLSWLQAQRQNFRFFAKNVIGGSDWPLRCEARAVRRSLHVKPGSQRNPRHRTPILATISDDARDLRLSAVANSATSKTAPLTLSWLPFPPQLSPHSDTQIAPGYHPFGPLRMSQITPLRAVSSFRKNEI